MSALSLRPQAIAQARQSVLREGNALPAPGLAPWVQRSWQRCLDLGLQPQHRVGFDAVSPAHMRQVREASAPLVQAAQPVLADMGRALGDIGYFAILTDAQGVVVDVQGPVDHSDRRAHAIARVGVDLSERAVGTTAIGAALRELQPVWLHQGEHFFDDTGCYSCAGAPVFGPDGHCAGMLDLTGIDRAERPGLKHLVRRAARSIENHWVWDAPAALHLRLQWPGQLPGDDGDGLLSLNAEGQVMGANTHARQMLGLEPGQSAHASDLFALPWGQLMDAAQHGPTAQELPLWAGLRVVVQAERTHAVSPTPPGPLKDLQTQLIRDTVRRTRGNVAEAARLLGISRATVYRKLGGKS